MDKQLAKRVFLCCCGFLLVIAMMASVLPSAELIKVSSEKKKVMYLTFDDGPSQNTQEILDILDRFHVKATFFVTAESPDHINMIKEEVKRGHAIGVHTYAHDYKTIYTSVDGYFKDVEKMNDIIEKQTGKRTKILRFPGGVSNTVSRKYASKIMSKLAKKVEEHGYHYYDWNASNGDGNCYTSVDSLINTGLKEVRNHDTVMMLMHDGGANKATVEALPTLLNSYIQQGFEFRIIDDTTPVFHHHIAN